VNALPDLGKADGEFKGQEGPDVLLETLFEFAAEQVGAIIAGEDETLQFGVIEFEDVVEGNGFPGSRTVAARHRDLRFVPAGEPGADCSRGYG
jgi:hypothetical protein